MDTNQQRRNDLKLHYSIRLGAAVLVAAALPAMAAHATQPDPEHKVRICHRTASDSNPWVSIEVDYAAVDGDGANDHSHHVADEQHDRGDIIPPVEGVTEGLNWDDGGQAIWANDCQVSDPDPTPPRLTQWCFPAVNLGEVVLQLDGGGEATLVDNSSYVLLTFEPNDFNLHLVGALGGLEPEDDQTPCPLRETPVVTPTPPVTPDSPVIEVSESGLQRQAQQFNPEGVSAAQAEVAAPADQLPFTGMSDWLAPLAGLLLAAGALFLKTARRA